MLSAHQFNVMSNPILADLLVFFAMQIARIHANLNPQTTHSRGPRKPDLADQEDNS